MVRKSSSISFHIEWYYDVPTPKRDKRQRFQTRAARVILGANHGTHSVDLLNILSWDTLENRRSGAKSVLMYKILNDHTAPVLRGSFVRREIDQTNYHLRNTATYRSNTT